MNLEELRKALADKIKALPEVKAAGMADDATEEQTKALDDLIDEIKSLKAKIAKAEEIEQIEADAAAPADTTASDDATGTRSTPAQPTENMPILEKVGVAITALMQSNANGEGKHWNAIADRMDKMGYGKIAVEFDARSKAMNSTTGASGGFAVAEDFNEEIFDELRPYTAFLRGMPDITPMPNGNYRQSGVASRPTVGYRAEGGVIAASEPTLREINMSAKLLGGIVPMTNQVINWTGKRAATKAQQVLSVQMGIHMDTAAFEGTGAANTPLGMFNQPNIVTRAAAATTTPTVAQVDADARQLINVMESYAGLQLGLAWVMPQRVLGYLQDLRDGNGNFYYPTLNGENPTWKGYPVLKTGTITVNGGVGTNETTVSLISFGNILFGESGGLSISISDEASYDSGGGTIVSAFANGLTLIRATMEHDWQPRYEEAVGVLTGVQWGAV